MYSRNSGYVPCRKPAQERLRTKKARTPQQLNVTSATSASLVSLCTRRHQSHLFRGQQENPFQNKTYLRLEYVGVASVFPWEIFSVLPQVHFRGFPSKSVPIVLSKLPLKS